MTLSVGWSFIMAAGILIGLFVWLGLVLRAAGGRQVTPIRDTPQPRPQTRRIAVIIKQFSQLRTPAMCHHRGSVRPPACQRPLPAPVTLKRLSPPGSVS